MIKHLFKFFTITGGLYHSVFSFLSLNI